jgi:hypothetical protein
MGEDGGLIQSHDGNDVAFLPVDTCKDFKIQSTFGRNEGLIDPWFIGEFLELKHLSDYSNPYSKFLGSQNLEGVRKHKRHKCVKI